MAVEAVVPRTANHQRRTAAPELPAGLTRREWEVLGLLVHRLTDAEIASQLFISPRTASLHVSRVLDKLGAANRREAGAIARRMWGM